MLADFEMISDTTADTCGRLLLFFFSFDKIHKAQLITAIVQSISTCKPKPVSLRLFVPINSTAFFDLETDVEMHDDDRKHT